MLLHSINILWGFGVSILTYFITYWCHIYSCNIYLFKVLFSLLKLRKYLPTPIQYTEEISSVWYCLLWPGLSSSLKIIIYPFSFLLPVQSSIWEDLLSQDLFTFKLLFLFSSFKVFATHFRILRPLWGTHYWIHILKYIFPVLSNSSRAHLSKFIVWCFFVKSSSVIASHEITAHVRNCVPGSNDETQRFILTESYWSQHIVSKVCGTASVNTFATLPGTHKLWQYNYAQGKPLAKKLQLMVYVFIFYHYFWILLWLGLGCYQSVTLQLVWNYSWKSYCDHKRQRFLSVTFSRDFHWRKIQW